MERKIKAGDSKRVKELYLMGYQFKEIIIRLHIGRMTAWRYIKQEGGLTLEDRATHLIKRKKLLDSGELR